ncbi:hypothetical protein C7S20_18560 [Christiangramia fulva]|uniref:Uncharacterized protein n=1 Tax=Christiangramia fulva TaxID=2126553 RepID=A0A2R3ZA03_9FLAO|nr:hypothetical protein [Christiangramia fulva]AVR47089.1 hypothetical protein C7S20_18560 [Christiangramia fulva]
MKKIFILIFFTVVFLDVSCSKDDNSAEFAYAFYNQTSCADIWGYSNDKYELAEKVKDFFETENIEILDVEFDNKGTPQLCNACICLTGKRIFIKVKIDDLNAIKEYGFQESN